MTAGRVSQFYFHPLLFPLYMSDRLAHVRRYVPLTDGRGDSRKAMLVIIRGCVEIRSLK